MSQNCSVVTYLSISLVWFKVRVLKERLGAFRMTSRERLMVAFGCGTPDRVPVSPQGFGRIQRESHLGRKLVAKTDITLYAGGGFDPFIGNSFQVET